MARTKQTYLKSLSHEAREHLLFLERQAAFQKKIADRKRKADQISSESEPLESESCSSTAATMNSESTESMSDATIQKRKKYEYHEELSDSENTESTDVAISVKNIVPEIELSIKILDDASQRLRDSLKKISESRQRTVVSGVRKIKQDAICTLGTYIGKVAEIGKICEEKDTPKPRCVFSRKACSQTWKQSCLISGNKKPIIESVSNEMFCAICVRPFVKIDLPKHIDLNRIYESDDGSRNISCRGCENFLDQIQITGLGITESTEMDARMFAHVVYDCSFFRTKVTVRPEYLIWLLKQWTVQDKSRQYLRLPMDIIKVLVKEVLFTPFLLKKD